MLSPQRLLTKSSTGAVLIVTTMLAISGNGARSQELYGASPADIKDRLAGLARSYPEWIAGFDDEFLILRNGQKFAISDGQAKKSFEELLEKPDIDDMFYATYPAGTVPRQPTRNSDPGRVRFEPLFVAMYGDCKKNGVAAKLRPVEWVPRQGGGRVMITTRERRRQGARRRIARARRPAPRFCQISEAVCRDLQLPRHRGIDRAFDARLCGGDRH